MAAALTFLKYEKIIQVDSPETVLDIQDLLNQIRAYEEKLINLDYGTIANAYGKQALGGGTYIGITLELINDWRIAFEARAGPSTVLCTISGGNLVAINAYSNNPIYPTAFTSLTISQSSSPTIIQSSSDYALMYMMESLRGKSTSVGSVFYWNPTSGSDANNGSSPALAVATFAQAQSLATAGASDIIFALSTASGGVTTVTEQLNITKAGLKIRGAGYQFQLIPTTNGAPTVTIAGDSVEFSGFYIKTAVGATDNGITITGDNALVTDCWIESVTGNGIDLSSSARTKILTCAIENSTGTGLKIGATTTQSKISQCIFSGNGADGVDLSGSDVSDNIFETNLVFNNTGYGIDVGAGVTRTGVRLNHTFSGNSIAATRDLGIQTFIESQAGGASASEVSDAVWDEIISGHAVAGSVAATLLDTKKKATLASIK